MMTEVERAITEVKNMITELESLRGTQDQTMRCGVIRIFHGTNKVDGMTPTERFLEDRIAYLKTTLNTAVADLFDEE